MTRWLLLTDRRQRRRAGWLAAALVLAVGWLIYHSGGYRYPLSDKERATVEQLMQQPQTRYFGYYAIDLPADFTPGGMTMFVHGSDMTRVDTKKQYYFPFKQFLERHEEELKNTRLADPLNAPYLKAVYPLPGALEGIIFERNRDPNTPDVARILEGWKWDNNVTLSVEQKARDGRSSKYDELRKVSKVYGYTVPEQKARIEVLLSGLTAREDTRPPSPGKLAVHLAEIEPRLLGTYEVAVTYLNTYKVDITLSTDNGSFVDTPLLENDRRVMELTNGSTLYKGRRDINGLTVSEWLIRSHSGRGAEALLEYSFELTIHEDKKGNRQILKMMMYYMPDLTKPAEILTEHELVALWQSITATLKYQPPAQPR